VVDIIEDETEYLIKVDLPEIKREEIKVTVENDVLVLSGERKLEKKKKAENITVLSGPMSALSAVSAYLTMRMPRRNAEFNDGVLKLHSCTSPRGKPLYPSKSK
jgi:HSP20 family protein